MEKEKESGEKVITNWLTSANCPQHDLSWVFGTENKKLGERQKGRLRRTSWLITDVIQPMLQVKWLMVVIKVNGLMVKSSQ